MKKLPDLGPYAVKPGTGSNSGLFDIVAANGNIVVRQMKVEANADLLATAWELRAALKRIAILARGVNWTHLSPGVLHETQIAVIHELSKLNIDDTEGAR